MPPGASSADLSRNPSREFLLVCVADQAFALPVSAVREIRSWIPSTPLPHAPAYVVGLVNLRGLVLPILSLAERLNLLTREPDATCVVAVVETVGGVFGLLVDAVSEIVTVADADIQPAPPVGGLISSDVIEGLIILNGAIVAVIGVASIAPSGAPALQDCAA